MNRTPTEHTEQVLLFRWSEFAENDKRMPKVVVGGKVMSVLEFLHAIPNGGYRNKKTAADMKAEGVKSGVPDIFLPYPLGKYHGLYIEMKRTQGGKLSDNQKTWLEYLNAQGYLAVVCRGFEQARDIIINYLTGKI